MLVDDNAMFLGILTHFLEQYPEVLVAGVAHNAQEALQAAPELQPDVILLDLVMPGLNGLDIIARLRQAVPATRIIILTLLDFESYRQKAFGAGADDFVAKANLDTALLPAIRKHAQPAAELACAAPLSAAEPVGAAL
jgi:DNA-binding NarL/FixJ family response regulator